jgi:hypothetical protein
MDPMTTLTHLRQLLAAAESVNRSREAVGAKPWAGGRQGQRRRCLLSTAGETNA